jgi:hypothetical protein
MGLTCPFASVDLRTAWLRTTLLGATSAGLLLSVPLWINSRDFPVLPIVPGFPILQSPWDKCLFGMMLLALVAAGWFYRVAIGFFLAASLFSYFEDQNRGQPWFYMYWVMLLLSLTRGPAAIAACRCALSVAYIWSGIQKFNPAFFGGIPDFFAAPAADWHLPSTIIHLLRWLIATAPFAEVGIGLALWIRPLRRFAIGAAVALHVGTLLFLGPLGRNYNFIIWPWNLAMIGLVCSLFANRSRSAQSDLRISQTLLEMRRSKFVAVVVALYSFLPALSYAGWWDSDFSFTLYAETQANANIFVTRDFADRLPAKLRRYVRPFPEHDPQFQGPNVFMFGIWCYEALHVPFVPEPRNFRSLFRHLRAYAKEPKELRMIIGPRSGPVIFYEGDTCVFLERKR